MAMKISKLDFENIEDLVPLWLKIIDHHEDFHFIYETENRDFESICNDIKDYFNQINANIYVAKAKNIIVGYILARIISRPRIFKFKHKMIIEGLFVSETHRGKKIGEMLLKFACIQHQEAEYIELDVSVKNQLGQNFWKNENFETLAYRMVKKV